MEETLVTIASYDNAFEAELAKNFLANSGIEAYLQNERMMGIYPSMAAELYYIKLQVSSSDESVAKRLLEESDDAAFTEEILAQMNALLEGHFLLTSGKHSSRYIEKIRVLQSPKAASLLCKRLANRLGEYEIDAVVGPAYGGIALAFETARHLGIDFVFSQRKEEKMTIRSGFDLSKIKRVAIVEDIVTTGSSVFEVIECLKDLGIDTVVVSSLVDRSGGKVDFGVPFEALLVLDIPAWEAEDCDLCKDRIPLVKPGASDKAKPLSSL